MVQLELKTFTLFDKYGKVSVLMNDMMKAKHINLNLKTKFSNKDVLTSYHMNNFKM